MSDKYKFEVMESESTFSTVGDTVLGPLDEKEATRGDAHAPITVFGELSFAIGNLPHKHKSKCLALKKILHIMLLIS